MGKGTRRLTRTPRWQKATALLPLVVLSGALSANAATGDHEQLAGSTPPPAKPGAPAVPSTAFDQPASVALPGGPKALSSLSAQLLPRSDFSFPTGDAPSSTASSGTASTNGIPASALKAYQRAAAILNQADPSCNIGWPVIAGIGRVESDHGRYGGSALNQRGRAQPAIYGVALDGSGSTSRILDTDGGQYDHDAVFDRAVGPMQFIPSTWSMVAVDADQDGVKDPQDIDDAATATAVYLCAGSDDLSTDAGRRAAVYRYNHSMQYVNLVLSIAATYAGGDYTAVPNGTPSSTTLVPQDFVANGRPASGPRNAPDRGGKGGSTSGGTAKSGSLTGGGNGGSGSGGGSSTGGSGGGSTGGSGGNGGSNGGSGGDGGDGGGTAPVPSQPQPPDPVGDTVDRVKKKAGDITKPAPQPAPSPSPSAAPDVLSLSEARALCRQHLPSVLVGACTNQVVGKTLDEALGIIAGLG